MSNTVRIVFYSQGEVEKVPKHTTEPCSECGAEKSQCLTRAQITEIGREAARAIGDCAHGQWFNGFIMELAHCYPDAVREALE